MSNEKFDFLKDLVANIPDQEEVVTKEKVKTPRKKKEKLVAPVVEGEAEPSGQAE